MWHRFTEELQHAVVYAQKEAELRNQKLVTPEHLFLGLLQNESQISCQLLQQVGCSVEAVREAIRASLSVGEYIAIPEDRTDEEFRLSPQGKLAIDLAYKEARLLHHRNIAPQHLLLGLITLNHPVIQEALAPYNLSPDTLREKVAFDYTPAPPNLRIPEKFADFRRFLSQKKR